jgi:beta-galactosidase
MKNFFIVFSFATGLRRMFPVFVIVLLSATNSFSQGVRLKENFDFDWKFALNRDDKTNNPKIDFDDSSWRNQNVPHDWSVEQNFSSSVNTAGAYLPGGIGWYRKTFIIPANYSGKKVSILFDGVFHQSDVYINGIHLGFHPYGYTSFEYDLTDYLNYGSSNVIAVRVDRQGNDNNPRWYGGSGIYRHVWLQLVNPVHIKTYGTYITTPTVTDANASVKIVSTLVNTASTSKTVTISQRILDGGGNQVATDEKTGVVLAANTPLEVAQTLSVINPERWDIDNPSMYTMETVVKEGITILDEYATPFGIRTIELHKDNGFFLNGRYLKLKGICWHQDASGFAGTAVPVRFDERRLEIMKEYGCNAIRVGHHPLSPEFMDLCDKMGFLVIDEIFDKWKSGYYEQYFDAWWQKDLDNMVLRDRNHPCVMLWSIGNELQEAFDGGQTGVNRAKMLQARVYELDATRKVMMTVQNGHQTHFASATDVIGYNYLEARMVSEKQGNYKDRICLVSEELPYFRGEEGNIRSYTTDNPWNIIAEHDFILGGFIWPGIDYLGESGWPSKGWPNGLFDVCMFEKPRAAYHRAMWNPEPMVRITVRDDALDLDHGRDIWQWPRLGNHWNFPQYKNEVMEIQTVTNCDKVALYFNDQFIEMKNTADFPNNTIIWYFPYQAGKLEAKAYNGTSQNPDATYSIETSGNTTKAEVKVDRETIKADGYDIAHITIQLQDGDGKPVQTDDRNITVTVTGNGTFLGIDNGDLRRGGNGDNFKKTTLNTYFGKAMTVVQSTRTAGTITVKIDVANVGSYTKTITTAN